MPIVLVSLRWRRLLRLSVRGLIVLVLITGAGLGWIFRSARIQREAVASLDRVGCIVLYDWQFSNGTASQGGEPWAPWWLVDLVGVDYFGHVTRVVFGDFSKQSDARLEPAGRLVQLEELDLSGSSVGDGGLLHLKGLSKLSTLNLSDTMVTNAGLAHLGGLSKLSNLNLSRSHHNDRFRLTDAGLAHLRELKKLTHLNLSLNSVTDTGLAQLKGLSYLSNLNVSGTKVTDAGLVHLKGLSSLSSLDLAETQVTDAGMVHLMGLRKLSSLNLLVTAVTYARVTDLELALPNLTIEH
jgi:Leucine-rich repeat (LRR) protein